jgi:hypothetical protein
MVDIKSASLSLCNGGCGSVDLVARSLHSVSSSRQEAVGLAVPRTTENRAFARLLRIRSTRSFLPWRILALSRDLASIHVLW